MGTATKFIFSIGDGLDTDYTVVSPDGNVSDTPVISGLYRTDWQLEQLLYSTQRTNKTTYSEQFNNAAWSKIRAACGAPETNVVVAPDGTTTGDKLLDSTDAGNTHYAKQTLTFTDSTVYTASVYVKAAEYTTGALLVIDKANALHYNNFNLTTGVAVASGAGTTAGIASVGNGWYRVWVTTNSGTGATTPSLSILPNTSGNYTGTGAKGIYVWGAQVEASATPTSYIQTVAANVNVTDYSLAGSVVTFASAPLTNALLAWSGTDNNPAFIPGHAGASMTCSFGNMGVR